LKDHGPGDDGKDCKQEQDAAGDPARLSKNVTEISDKNRSEQKNDATPQLEINLPDFRNVAQAYRVVKTNQMRKRRSMLSLWNRQPPDGPRIRHKVRLRKVRLVNLPGNGDWPDSVIARLDAKS
jgi:hypothetical protein